MTWLLGTRFGRTLLAMVAAVMAVFGARAAWKAEGRQEANAKQDHAYKETRRRMDRANGPLSPDDARERLRDFADRQRDL